MNDHLFEEWGRQQDKSQDHNFEIFSKYSISLYFGDILGVLDHPTAKYRRGGC